MRHIRRERPTPELTLADIRPEAAAPDYFVQQWQRRDGAQAEAAERSRLQV
jgi:hypothetical protein